MPARSETFTGSYVRMHDSGIAYTPYARMRTCIHTRTCTCAAVLIACSISMMRSLTSIPETGEAVVAMRMMLCDRDTSYPSRPKETRGQKSCTVKRLQVTSYEFKATS